MKAATGTAPFLAALRGERPSRRPVWIMRQAGRYLPEYQELRRSATFEELCTTPELACEATLQPLRRFDLDAAILFSDILVPLAPMGAPFVIEEGGPKTPHPIRTDADVQNLRVVDPREEIPFVADAVRLL
ncbi:MAG: uroporphyrinogen decarboxylase family protein, partial [Gemmatimonadota bacterium]|nr:uroporphyrinogen decarboxylase family protein [Gemmatimonadota bacterium]